MNQNHLIGTWGYCHFALNKLGAIHPDDTEIYKKFWSGAWYCKGLSEDGYLILDHNTAIIRATADSYWVFPINPIYKIGDEVNIKIEPHFAMKARIENIGWHSNHKREYYHLRIGKRKSSRWYWRDDIEPYTET